jgi:alkylhydroperoxidase/carboxymuconolactone decarboxylase family protein YurZ
MQQKSNPLDVFKQEAPDVAEAFNGLVNSLESLNGLDAKTKHLVYIGIKSALGDVAAVYYHVPMAKKAGASRNEIRDAILITLTVCGLTAVATCLPVALDIYDRSPGG